MTDLISVYRQPTTSDGSRLLSKFGFPLQFCKVIKFRWISAFTMHAAIQLYLLYSSLLSINVEYNSWLKSGHLLLENHMQYLFAKFIDQFIWNLHNYSTISAIFQFEIHFHPLAIIDSAITRVLVEVFEV